jgi:formate hydrogenlyase subunit 6/NADH:ubiquinone oxidoreductase subunit I
MNLAQFTADPSRCVGCGRCTKVCPGGLLFLDDNRKSQIRSHDQFGWNGCWKCQHCLTVCPTGAISVLGCRPENSEPAANPDHTQQVLENLVKSRHSCRRYQQRNVEKGWINRTIQLLANAPNGGNKQQVEYTLIDDKDQMEQFRRLAYTRMEELAATGIYPEGFDQPSYQDMKHWESTVRPDMLFCGAPHLLIPHAPVGKGEPIPDVNIAGTYFELLCAASGIGCIMMTFPLGVLDLMPDIKSLLQIPENHYIGTIIGFGYPEIPYARTVQKTISPERIHRPFQEEKATQGETTHDN